MDLPHRLYKSPFLKCSFEWLYHLPGSSLFNELKEILAVCLYYTCLRDFSFWEMMFYKAVRYFLEGLELR